MILTATIRRQPEPHATTVDGLETRAITAEGDSYDEAKAGIDAQIPDGWQALFVREQ